MEHKSYVITKLLKVYLESYINKKESKSNKKGKGGKYEKKYAIREKSCQK